MPCINIRDIQRIVVGISVATFIDFIHPRNLLMIKSLDEIIYLKELMTKRLCRGKCKSQRCGHKAHCSNCNTIKRYLWRAYHNYKDPRHEVVARIMYEYLFDFISLRDIKGDWLNDSLRDWGHDKRISERYHLAYDKYGGLNCRWLE